MKKNNIRWRVVLAGMAACAVSVVGAQFSDVDSTSIEGEAIDFLVTNEVIGGYPDGTFHGEAEVNRAEAAKMLLLARGIGVGDLKNAGQFSDIPEEAWFRSYVMRAANLGILQGYAGGAFLPGNPVNTAEFLKMLTRTFELSETLTSDYSDVPADAWFASFAGVAQAYGVLPNRTDRLEPAKKLTRNEVAVAIFQVMADPEMVLSPVEELGDEPAENNTPAAVGAEVTVVNTNTNPMLIMTNAGKIGESAMSLDFSTNVPVTITSLQFRLKNTAFFDTVRVEESAAVVADRMRVTVPADVLLESSATVLVYVDVAEGVRRGETEQLFLERIDWVDADGVVGNVFVDLPGYELMGL